MSKNKKYSHYFKEIPEGVKRIDVYGVFALFDVTDPAIQHSIKKLLVAGKRGSKSFKRDLTEARDAIDRRIEMGVEGYFCDEDDEKSSIDPSLFPHPSIKVSDDGKFIWIDGVKHDLRVVGESEVNYVSIDERGVLVDKVYPEYPWDDIPEEYGYCATDDDGEVYAYKSGELRPGGCAWCSDDDLAVMLVDSLTCRPVKLGNVHWTETKMMRPVK